MTEESDTLAHQDPRLAVLVCLHVRDGTRPVGLVAADDEGELVMVCDGCAVAEAETGPDDLALVHPSHLLKAGAAPSDLPYPRIGFGFLLADDRWQAVDLDDLGGADP